MKEIKKIMQVKMMKSLYEPYQRQSQKFLGKQHDRLRMIRNPIDLVFLGDMSDLFIHQVHLQ
jgi:hypothetical protein